MTGSCEGKVEGSRGDLDGLVVRFEEEIFSEEKVPSSFIYRGSQTHLRHRPGEEEEEESRHLFLCGDEESNEGWSDSSSSSSHHDFRCTYTSRVNSQKDSSLPVTP
ncbi:hypothetical protein CSUI_005719, partial [Cystoisospora suis]